MNLNEALFFISEAFHFNAEELQAYAAEDNLGGFDPDILQRKFPTGSLWGVEGQVLYALVRVLKPKLAIECGTMFGASASHIALALQANNDGGHLICLDPERHIAQGYPTDGAIGHLIPEELRPFCEIVHVFAQDWIPKFLPDGEATFIYEDAAHTSELTRLLWEVCTPKLGAGGVMVSHDAAHYLVGADVRKGILQSGAQDFHVYLIEPADCGLAVWRAPQDRVFPHELKKGSEYTQPAIKRDTTTGRTRTRKSKVMAKGKTNA